MFPNPNANPMQQSMMMQPPGGRSVLGGAILGGADPRRNLTLTGALEGRLAANASLIRPAIPAIAPPTNQVPIPTTVGIPSTLVNDMYQLIDMQRASLQVQLIDKQIPAVVEEVEKLALAQKVPVFVIDRVNQTLEDILREKLKTEVPKAFASAMIDKYGPAVVNVMQTLKDGKLVCSKPCICGEGQKSICSQKDKSTGGGPPAASGGCDPSYPDDCIETCPCVVAAKKKEAEERKKLDVDADGKPICPCMRRK